MALRPIVTFPLLICLCALFSNDAANGFISPTLTRHESCVRITVPVTVTLRYRSLDVSLSAAQKKRRRKRKDSPPAPTLGGMEIPSAVEDETPLQPALGDFVDDSDEEYDDDDDEEEFQEENTVVLEPEASDKMTVFKFDRNEAVALGIEDASENDDIPDDFKVAAAPKLGNVKGAIELPDIKDSVTRKKSKAQSTEEEVQEVVKEKIKRSDVKMFTKLLEVEPNADTDMTYFEEEEYGAVSALLGEGAKSFLGLPFSVLQVGHFIGALGIILMAFVEYPGFPLTNLPTSVREALQGGLGTIYLINTVLAVLAVFRAEERGQPKALWAIKTFSVGGLAYDQLTQLPTKGQMAKIKSGKRRGRQQ